MGNYYVQAQAYELLLYRAYNGSTSRTYQAAQPHMRNLLAAEDGKGPSYLRSKPEKLLEQARKAMVKALERLIKEYSKKDSDKAEKLKTDLLKTEMANYGTELSEIADNALNTLNA